METPTEYTLENKKLKSLVEQVLSNYNFGPFDNFKAAVDAVGSVNQEDVDSIYTIAHGTGRSHNIALMNIIRIIKGEGTYRDRNALVEDQRGDY